MESQTKKRGSQQRFRNKRKLSAENELPEKREISSRAWADHLEIPDIPLDCKCISCVRRYFTNISINSYPDREESSPRFVRCEPSASSTNHNYSTKSYPVFDINRTSREENASTIARDSIPDQPYRNVSFNRSTHDSGEFDRLNFDSPDIKQVFLELLNEKDYYSTRNSQDQASQFNQSSKQRGSSIMRPGSTAGSFSRTSAFESDLLNNNQSKTFETGQQNIYRNDLRLNDCRCAVCCGNPNQNVFNNQGQPPTFGSMLAPDCNTSPYFQPCPTTQQGCGCSRPTNEAFVNAPGEGDVISAETQTTIDVTPLLTQLLSFHLNAIQPNPKKRKKQKTAPTESGDEFCCHMCHSLYQKVFGEEFSKVNEKQPNMGGCSKNQSENVNVPKSQINAMPSHYDETSNVMRTCLCGPQNNFQRNAVYGANHDDCFRMMDIKYGELLRKTNDLLTLLGGNPNPNFSPTYPPQYPFYSQGPNPAYSPQEPPKEYVSSSMKEGNMPQPSTCCSCPKDTRSDRTLTTENRSTTKSDSKWPSDTSDMKSRNRSESKKSKKRNKS